MPSIPTFLIRVQNGFSLSRARALCIFLGAFCSNVVPFDPMDAREITQPATNRNEAFTQASAWYLPRPQDLLASSSSIEVPALLAKAVPFPLRSEAAALLEHETMIRLSDQQLRHFWPEARPESNLQTVIAEGRKKLRYFETNPPANDMNFTSEQRERMKRAAQGAIASISPQIRQYEQWAGRLKPYLVRGVALDEASGFFNGRLYPSAILIGHICYSSKPLAMHNVPVIIFLPEAPKQLYNTATRLSGWN